MPRLSQDRNLPTAVTRIRLGSALSDCGALHIDETFDKSTAPRLFVYDDSDLGYTDWVDIEPAFKYKCFKVLNPNGTIMVLVPLDGRIITGVNIIQGGVCDGMLLTEKEMTLVEFKTDVVSKNYQTILQRASDAIGQLLHTFDAIIKPRCMRLSKDLESLLTIDFYVVFDKDLEITRTSSQLMDMQTQFLEDYKHLLYFDNEKVFT